MKYATVKDIAKMLQLSEWTVSEWAKKGKIPAVKMGGKVWRFDPEAVRRAVDEGKVTA